MTREENADGRAAGVRRGIGRDGQVLNDRVVLTAHVRVSGGELRE